MFSRAKRFNYPEPEDLSASVSFCSKNHPVHTPRKRCTSFSESKNTTINTSRKRATSLKRAKSTPKRCDSSDLDHILDNLHLLEAKMQDRCQELDNLAASASTSRDDGYSTSSRTSSPPVGEVQAVPAIELGTGQNLDELCEVIAELVCKKMKKKENLWQRGKAFWKSFWGKYEEGGCRLV